MIQDGASSLPRILVRRAPRAPRWVVGCAAWSRISNGRFGAALAQVAIVIAERSEPLTIVSIGRLEPSSADRALLTVVGSRCVHPHPWQILRGRRAAPRLGMRQLGVRRLDVRQLAYDHSTCDGWMCGSSASGVSAGGVSAVGVSVGGVSACGSWACGCSACGAVTPLQRQVRCSVHTTARGGGDSALSGARTAARRLAARCTAAWHVAARLGTAASSAQQPARHELATNELGDVACAVGVRCGRLYRHGGRGITMTCAVGIDVGAASAGVSVRHCGHRRYVSVACGAPSKQHDKCWHHCKWWWRGTFCGQRQAGTTRDSDQERVVGRSIGPWVGTGGVRCTRHPGGFLRET